MQHQILAVFHGRTASLHDSVLLSACSRAGRGLHGSSNAAVPPCSVPVIVFIITVLAPTLLYSSCLSAISGGRLLVDVLPPLDDQSIMSAIDSKSVVPLRKALKEQS